MRYAKHVTNTWLVSLHLFPFIFLLYDSASSGSTETGLLLPVAFFGLLFSLPPFVLCLVFFKPILNTSFSPMAKLRVWMALVSLCIISSATLLNYLFFGLFIEPEMIAAAGAAIAAALLSVMLRLKQFLHLVTIQNKNYENELV